MHPSEKKLEELLVVKQSLGRIESGATRSE